MSEKNWLARLDHLALHLEAVVWIKRIDDPHAVVVLSRSGCACYLFLRNWRAYRSSILVAAKAELFPEEIVIGFDAQFLAVPDELVAAEHVDVVHARQLVD